jgi:hypothetical protein
MKFEDHHDPDPIRRKFVSVDSIADIPEEMKQRIGLQYENLLENLDLLAQTSLAQIEGADDMAPAEINNQMEVDAVVRYMALMQTQIGDLQAESQKIWHSIVDLTQVVHDLIENLEE